MGNAGRRFHEAQHGSERWNFKDFVVILLDICRLRRAQSLASPAEVWTGIFSRANGRPRPGENTGKNEMGEMLTEEGGNR